MSPQELALSRPSSSFPAFDYGAMSKNDVAAIKAKADKIRQLNQSGMATVIEVGRELTDIKNKLPHGQFGAWVEGECRFDKRTAERYMGYARLAEKNDTVSLLSPSLVYLLAAKSAPVAIVDDVLDRAGKGEVIIQHEVKERIREATRQRRHEAKKEMKREDRKRRAEAEKRWESEKEKREAAAREKEEREQQAAGAILEKLGPDNVRFLLEQLGEDWWGVLRHLRDAASPSRH